MKTRMKNQTHPTAAMNEIKGQAEYIKSETKY